MMPKTNRDLCFIKCVKIKLCFKNWTFWQSTLVLSETEIRILIHHQTGIWRVQRDERKRMKNEL